MVELLHEQRKNPSGFPFLLVPGLEEINPDDSKSYHLFLVLP
jgi:hypothetical protein